MLIDRKIDPGWRYPSHRTGPYLDAFEVAAIRAVNATIKTLRQLQ
jgi:hypothetical protein